MVDDSYTGADLFVDALEQYGVTHVFGNPGTTELPVMNSLSDADLKYVLCLHEDIAVGMGAGYASARLHHSHYDDVVTPVGVANLHITPGVAHGIGNLYAAMHSGSPLVLTAGNHSTDYQHTEPVLSGDLVEMTEQFTKWSAEVQDVSALPTMLRRAFRTAMTPPTGPVFLSIPMDVSLAETDARPERLGHIPSGGRGNRSDVQRAADLIVEADDPILVVGDQVGRSGREAVSAAVSLAESSGAKVHGEPLASEVNFDVDHDQWISPLSPQPSVAPKLLNTDTIVFAGAVETMSITRPHGEIISPETRCVYLGTDAWQLGKNHTADATVIGDPGEIMAELADLVDDELPAERREERLERVTALNEKIDAKISDDPSSDQPLASKDELIDRVGEVVPDAYVVDEAITTKQALLTRWPLKHESYFGNKGGGLGYGLPASLGVAAAEAERGENKKTVAVVGDGSYLYYPHSLYTAARYDIDLTVVVPDNRNYRILKNNMTSILGGDHEDYDFVGMDFEPAVDIVGNARTHGASSHLVESPDEIGPVVERAVKTDGPAVVDILIHD